MSTWHPWALLAILGCILLIAYRLALKLGRMVDIFLQKENFMSHKVDDGSGH